jgi:hypothetical protein
MVPGDVWVLLGESGGRARGCSAFHVPITWSMPTWEGTRLAPGKVMILELLRERSAGSCFPWICDISFLSVSLANGSFVGPTQAPCRKSGQLKFD